jgi:RHS repeat-associated protein
MDNETYGTGNEYDYGFRIYNTRLGKFLSVDPLTQTFPMLTPYQFASNSPIWAIDLDGLEAKIYQSSLKDNWGFKTMMAIADQTTLGKEFNDVLKSQNKIDVYYFSYTSKVMINPAGDVGDAVSVSNDGFAEGTPGAAIGVTGSVVINSMDEFNELRLGNSRFSSINPADVEESLKSGKGLVLIGITEKMINPPTSSDFDREKLANFRISGTETLLHEQWAHARTLLMGQNINPNTEHKNYHGDESSSSPSASNLLTGSKYSLTNAGKAIKEIQSIAKKSYKLN